MTDFIIETEVKQINETFYINQVNKNYKLTITLNSDNITLNISELNKFMQSYEIKLNLEQIKEKHDIFSHINSLQDFFDIIKNNIEKKGILINKPSENLIHFEFKKNSIFFELTKVIINNLSKVLENINILNDKYNTRISSLENKLVNIYNENRYMKNEIDELKKTNDILVNNIKTLKEEIKNKKEIKNRMEFNNNKIQYLKERFIKKQKMKKDEEIKRSEEISKLKSQKDNLILESLKKNLNIFITNKDEKESQKNYMENLNTNINNINTKVKEKSKIKIIKKNQEYSKDNDSELNEQLVKIKKNDKYFKYNYKTNIPVTNKRNLNKIPHKIILDSFDININEFNDKNKKKNIFPPIFITNNIDKENQILNTQRNFYTKKNDLIHKEELENTNKIMRYTYSENKIFSKDDNKGDLKSVSKKILFDDKKVKSNNKRINFEKIKLKTDKDDEINNFQRFTILGRNLDTKNDEVKKNSLIHRPKTPNNLKEIDCDICILF